MTDHVLFQYAIELLMSVYLYMLLLTGVAVRSNTSTLSLVWRTKRLRSFRVSVLASPVVTMGHREYSAYVLILSMITLPPSFTIFVYQNFSKNPQQVVYKETRERVRQLRQPSLIG